MKKYIFLFVFILGFVTVSLAQPQVKFSMLRYEFGTMVWNESEVTEFEVANGGDTPLYILKVHPDCDCTTIAFTKEAIAPGAKGIISVRYDASLLGHFEKQVAVYTNADKQPYYLTIAGDVVRERSEYTGDYPYRIGDIYLSTDMLEFDNVYSGETSTQLIMLHNTGRQSYEPTLMHLPKYLSVRAEPTVVRPGRVGKLYVTLDSDQLPKMGLTQTSVFLSRFPGDRVNSDNKVMISAIHLPKSAGEYSSSSPVATFDSQKLVLSGMGSMKKLKGSILLTNTGKSNLEISALQVYKPGLGVSVRKTIIPPGRSEQIRVTFHPESGDSHVRHRFLIITNDPVRPKVDIEVEIKK